MNEKHTAGLWKAHNAGSGHAGFTGYVSAPGGEVICCTQDFADMAESSANARLIAAAPELLEACKTAMVIISQHYPANATCCNDRINQVRAAIAAAEGRE